MSGHVAWLTARGALIVTKDDREIVMTRSVGHVSPQLRKLGYEVDGAWETFGDATAVKVRPLR